jgi:hypothetical protein
MCAPHVGRAPTPRTLGGAGIRLPTREKKMTRKWNTSIVVALIALVGSLPASASAQGFKITKIGKGKMVAGSAQLIKTAAGTIECKKASAALELTALEFMVLEAPKLEYSECSGLGGAAHVTPASVDFNADGAMQLEKTMTIEAEGAGCSFVFERASGEAISYSISKSGLQVLDLDVSGLPYSGTGGECGGSGKATYSGVLEAEDTGGKFF